MNNGLIWGVLALSGIYRIPDPLRRADHAARMQCKGILSDADGVALGPLVAALPSWDC